MSDVLITSIEGNTQKLDGGAMFGNAPRVVWEKWIKPDSLGRIPLACRSMLIEIGDRKILCETGIGAFFEPKLRDRFGVEGQGHLLRTHLRAAGVNEDQITDVILSHLHFDHAGGMLTPFEEGEPKLVFKNANIFVGEEAWARAQKPHSRDRASFIPVLNALLSKTDRLRVISKRAANHPELPKEISFTYTDGHTPGQLHTIVQGTQHRMLFCGDMIPGRAWVHVPITMGYDRYPEKLIDEKNEVLGSFASGQDWLFYTHDWEVACSKVKREGEKFVPAENQTICTKLKI